ncbi:AAA family ATPase [Micromonospora sp. 4G57]|uniref:AAA family ATPase n=1 Tax=Micromonospora sicca TaxID=2202420 RepID=A0ABU5JAF6_9ACTN|nr:MULTISPECIES: AAA family ATPase [unclassified Micromonospora]MDZ5444182.1 AAA family ATPase [Micromonospora sp. 4G57]MDZ5489464.1 AAA family ATPase [Micromonospora sp. 4G53]
MHDDGRYDDRRVTGPGGRSSAADPVSRETDKQGWPVGAEFRDPSPRPPGREPVVGRDAPPPGRPHPISGVPANLPSVAGGPQPTSGVPANLPPMRKVPEPTDGPTNAPGSRSIPARGNPAASARFEPSAAVSGPSVPQQPAPNAVPDAGPAAVSADTPPVADYEAEAAHSTYVSRETPTREEDDPPLAMEAMRAVQILNPSGEVTMPRPDRTRVMCVANQKGGVGKTTTTVNLAVALALHGNRVLVVDLDPQGNASTGLNVPHHTGIPDVYDCLIDSVPLEEVAQAVEGIPNLWCVPATIDLAGAEIELVSVVARESRLARAIAAYPGHFDYVFIDCPPSLGLLTVNALVAAQEVLIPIQCEYYALEGLNQLINNINLVRQHLNPKLEVSTILLTMYDRRTRLADAVEQDVRNHFGDKVLQAVIPRNVRVSEAPSYGQSVMTYDPGSRGATSYFEAAQEIAERGVKEPVRNA